MKRIISTALLALILVVGAVGCSSSDGDGGGNGGGGSASDPDAIQIATGGTSGVYYPLGGGMANIFSEKMDIKASAQTTGASVENMQLLSKGSVQVAFTQNDILEYAVNGGEEKVLKEKLDKIQAVGALYPEIIQLVVLADSDIQSIQDLKGKKVSVGAAGSGNEANSRQILEAAGLSYDDIKPEFKSYGDSADAFKDGGIDAMFVTSGIPNSAVQDIAVTKGVRVLGLDDDIIKKIKDKYPFYIDSAIPDGSYEGQKGEVKTVAVLASLAVNSDLSEDFVYNLTKSLFENLEELEKTNAKASEIELKKALEGITVPVHPGAEKYYKEKGIEK
ncbi:TAXI family TRAP transporter solute-binding subunit [Numidum massiliense]|uniref:TAXI family TRAP transporter solute-binding subunit n=1 Tax=Numidum massiliense TaxID=1522315 RepID=UPI0006D59C8C|nr:TAXI family TRAP transporter solute-binding subunit [Numidum massiliense]